MIAYCEIKHKNIHNSIVQTFNINVIVHIEILNSSFPKYMKNIHNSIVQTLSINVIVHIKILNSLFPKYKNIKVRDKLSFSLFKHLDHNIIEHDCYTTTIPMHYN